MSKITGSKKATQFTESVIREMTRLNHLYGGVNLSQGFPDFPAPAAVKEAACAAINADINQYAVTWGAQPLREAVAREFTRRYGLPVVADEQVTVCCGSTEAMMATMMAIIDPGDEVVIFEPFYENYGPDTILSGATPRYVTLHEPDWSFDPDDLAAVADRGDPEGARFPDRRRRRAAAGGGRGRAHPARRLLREARGQLPAAARRPRRHPRPPSLHDLQAVRRVLHHDRHQHVRLQRRCCVRAVPGQGCRRRRGAGQQLLQDRDGGPEQAAVLLLQE